LATTSRGVVRSSTGRKVGQWSMKPTTTPSITSWLDQVTRMVSPSLSSNSSAIEVDSSIAFGSAASRFR